MTIEETKDMIEVLEAYIKGEEIELSDIDDNIWIDMTIPEWNFENYKYRIKHKEENIKAKFKQGDEIVHKELCDGTPLNKDNSFLVVEDINLSENKYEVYNKRIGAYEFFDIKMADEDYINTNDCLWYWEYYNTNYKAFTKTAVRYNKEDCIDYLVQIASDNLPPTPIYQLGARLPKERE